MVKYEEYERAGDGFEDGIGNKKRWGKRGGDREKGGGGETRIRGASRFSVYERVNDSVPMFVGPNDFQRQSEQSLLLRGVVPFLWRSPPPSFVSKAHCSARRILCIRFIPPNVFVTVCPIAIDSRANDIRKASWWIFLLFLTLNVYTFDIWCRVISSILLCM